MSPIAPTSIAPITSHPTTHAPVTTGMSLQNASVYIIRECKYVFLQTLFLSIAPTTHAPETPPTGIPTSLSPVTTSPTSHAPITVSPTSHAPVTTAPSSHAPITTAPTSHSPVTSTPTTAAPHPSTILQYTNRNAGVCVDSNFALYSKAYTLFAYTDGAQASSDCADYCSQNSSISSFVGFQFFKLAGTQVQW